MAVLQFEGISDLKRQPTGIRGFPLPMSAQMESDMPFRSERQRKFFNSVGAKKAGITKSEVKEFNNESRGVRLPEKAPKRRHKVSYPKPK